MTSTVRDECGLPTAAASVNWAQTEACRAVVNVMAPTQCPQSCAIGTCIGQMKPCTFNARYNVWTSQRVPCLVRRGREHVFSGLLSKDQVNVNLTGQQRSSNHASVLYFGLIERLFAMTVC